MKSRASDVMQDGHVLLLYDSPVISMYGQGMSPPPTPHIIQMPYSHRPPQQHGSQVQELVEQTNEKIMGCNGWVWFSA